MLCSCTGPGALIARPQLTLAVGFDFLATTETFGMTPPRRETMLVVDDEEMVRRLAARILLGEGYHVLEAGGGDEAIRLLQRASQRIDLVVTDVAMPGIGGRQLGDTIFRCWPKVRVLFMSGFPAQRIVNEGALDPASPFLQKPFTRDQLTRKVKHVLAMATEQ
jgi:two-component system, cell cycle sensor histidine kinase and response regulator CckA